MMILNLFLICLLFALLILIGQKHRSANLYLKSHQDIETSLQETTERLESFFNNTADAINITNLAGELIYVNPSFENMYGWRSEEIMGKPLPIIPDDLKSVEKRNRELLLEGKSVRNWEAQFLHKKGKHVHVNVSISPLKHSDGTIYGFAAITRDETERKKIENNYKIIAENSSSIIRLIDKKGIVQFASPSHKSVLGYAPDELVGKPYYINIHPEDREKTIQAFTDMIKNPQTTVMEYRKKHRNGHALYIEAHCTPYFNNENQLQQYIVVSRDITENKRYEQKLEELAYSDPLTGTGNRRHFYKLLAQAFQESTKSKGQFAILMLDCDRFKWVNDTMGHDVGDEFLQHFVRRIKEMLPQTASICRLGGDEFAIILPDITMKEEINDVAMQIIDTMQKPWIIQDQHFVTTCSIGISTYPLDGENQKELLSNADQALYQAKADGGNSFRFFSDERETENRGQENIENILTKSIDNGDFDQFHLVYQPQINLETGEVECFEVLLRFHHPLIGNVPPDEFIPVIEKNGQIDSVTTWVIQQVGNQYRQWMGNGYSSVKFSINISPTILQTNHSFILLIDSLHKWKLPLNCLEIEVTEDVFMDNFLDMMDQLYQLKDLGVSVSLDDFGTDFSSLLYYKHLPIDKIKIDKSVLHGIFEKEKKGDAIIHSIVLLAKELDIKVLCEGVETEEQVQYLRNNKLKYAQGFYFSKPVSGREIEQLGFLKTERQTH
jgi:diguanylate cyclase (GGDEF)-like protein/PAS domain S-box-containing protein